MNARHAGPGRAAALLFALAAGACAGGGSSPGSAARTPGPGDADPAAEVRDAVHRIVAAPPMDRVHWGIVVSDPETGEEVVSRNADRHFAPASVTKLVVTSTALSLLGRDFRYRTPVYGTSPLRDGTLPGHLVVEGSGDPTLSERFYPSDTAALDTLAARLRDAGLRRIRGDLVVDVSAWDTTDVPGSWMVGNLPWRYAAMGGAFAVAEGEITVEVAPAATPGEPARVRWWPVGDPGYVVNRIVTDIPESDATVRPVHRPERGRLELAGRVPAGSEPDRMRLSVREPVAEAAHALRRRLEARGIAVDGSVRVIREPGAHIGPYCRSGRRGPCPARTGLAVLESPPLSEIVKAILEPSQNWIAEQLVRTLGALRGPEGGWAEGLRVEEEFLVEEVGVDSLAPFLRDGSGLSAQNLLTPRAVVKLLTYMRSSPVASLFRDALAAPGEEGSTLRRRLLELEGRLQGKTGTITHVNALSGYVETDSGRELVFSILTNGSGLPSRPVRSAMNDVVLAVARGL